MIAIGAIALRVQLSVAPTAWTFSDTDNPVVEYRELVSYIESTGRPRRLVQVDLETQRKVSQYTDIDSSPSGFGKNACGLVAAAAALGGEDWKPLVSKIAQAAGKDYTARAGIQPLKYVAALQQVFGTEHVSAIDRGSLGELYQELDAGQIVIVDIKVDDNRKVPSAQPPNYAHFARVLGMDIDAREIYIENTLSGKAYWTVSLDTFVNAWRLPETSSSIILDRKNAEDVTRWAVVIDGTLIPADNPQ